MLDNRIKLQIIKPDGIELEIDCISISLPSREGIIEIMPNCEGTVIELIKGIIFIVSDETKTIDISSGFTIFEKNFCKILLIK